MQKKHLLSKKAPVLSMLLASGLAMVLTGMAVNMVPGASGNEVLEDTILAIASIAVLLVFQWWFSPEFKGDFKLRIPLAELLIISIPYVFKVGMTVAGSVLDSGWYFNPTLVSLVMGLSVGFIEETWFRGLSVPIGMGYLDKKYRIPLIVGLTSVAFGIMHMGNVFAGANVAMAIIQGVASTFTGLFFVAVYLRSGSILVPIAMHSFFDLVCFVTDPTLVGGIMTSSGVTIGIVLQLVADIAVGLIGIYLVRPAMWGRIDQVWSQIWSQPEEAGQSEVASRSGYARAKHRKS